MKNILIFGATSAIAKATARKYARQGQSLVLFGRNTEKLEVIAQDLKIRGAGNVIIKAFDAMDMGAHDELIEETFSELPNVDIALIAYGTLPDQKQCQQDATKAIKEINTNATSIVSLLTPLANKMEKQRKGTIAVISSVAGDRGRQSNYVYGAAKSLVSTFLQGLRNRLFKSGINVLDIKPGFVDTPMTESFNKGLLWAQPEQIAEAIVTGIEKKKSTLYTPFFWRYIMLIIKYLPESIFKRARL